MIRFKTSTSAVPERQRKYAEEFDGAVLTRQTHVTVRGTKFFDLSFSASASQS